MSNKSASIDRSGRDAKLEAIRRQNEADKRRTRIIAGVTAAVIVALVAIVAVVIYGAVQENATNAGSNPDKLTAVPYQPADAGGAGEGGEVNGFAVGPADAAATVTIYEDYLCPACKQFEEAFGGYVNGLPDQGVRVVYSPVAILDRLSQGTQYSSRAASAAACVAESDDADLTMFKAFSTLLFAQQPAEGTAGLESTELAGLASSVGASAEVVTCIEEDRYVGWAARSTTEANDAGLTGTPFIQVNGVAVESSQQAIQAAIDAAGGTSESTAPSAPASN